MINARDDQIPRPGFEPRLTGPEPVVLPLNDLGRALSSSASGLIRVLIISVKIFFSCFAFFLGCVRSSRCSYQAQVVRESVRGFHPRLNCIALYEALTVTPFRRVGLLSSFDILRSFRLFRFFSHLAFFLADSVSIATYSHCRHCSGLSAGPGNLTQTRRHKMISLVKR